MEHLNPITDSDSLLSAWKQFLSRGAELADAIGPDGVQCIRVKITNWNALEHELGLGRAAAHRNEAFRLAAETLPPHFPTFVAPTGEFIILLDSMMSSFFLKKIQSLLSNHLGVRTKLALAFSFCGAPRSATPEALENAIKVTKKSSAEISQISNIG